MKKVLLLEIKLGLLNINFAVCWLKQNIKSKVINHIKSMNHHANYLKFSTGRLKVAKVIILDYTQPYEDLSQFK